MPLRTADVLERDLLAKPMSNVAVRPLMGLTGKGEGVIKIAEILDSPLTKPGTGTEALRLTDNGNDGRRKQRLLT